ncbi:MAG: hypothetical protein WBQ73_01505 [Candidatus Babeliales bacterium]
MVGHTGNMHATIKAIECLDQQLAHLYYEVVQRKKGSLFITADYGNAEAMYSPRTGKPLTSHTCNLVPFIAVSIAPHHKLLPLPKQLSAIAPYLLRYLNLPVPPEMMQQGYTSIQD